jgi:hypothetical protein
VFSSISYSGAGPHIKSSSSSSTVTVGTPVTLVGAQTAGASTADVIAKPTNASRVGSAFEVQTSAGVAALQAFDTGRVFSLSSANYNYLAKATSTNASGLEFKNSADATVGAHGFAGTANQGVTGTAVGDTIITDNTDTYFFGRANNAKHGARTSHGRLRTVDSATTVCDSVFVADNTVYTVISFVVGRRTDIAGRSIHIRRAGVFKAGGATTFVTGSPSTPFADQTSGTASNLVGMSLLTDAIRTTVTNLDGGGAIVEWTCVMWVEAIAGA